MEMKKLTIFGSLLSVSALANAHPGHGESLLEDVFHTLTAADHLPVTIVVAIALVTGLLIWQSRR